MQELDTNIHKPAEGIKTYCRAAVMIRPRVPEFHSGGQNTSLLSP